MWQKIVMKVHMTCSGCRSTAMKHAAEAEGVISVAIEGANGDRLVVIGDGVDSGSLIRLLTKKVGRATIVSVEVLNRIDESTPNPGSSSNILGITDTALGVPRQYGTLIRHDIPPTHFQVREDTPSTHFRDWEDTPSTHFRAREDTPPTHFRDWDDIPPTTNFRVRDDTSPTHFQFRGDTPPIHL